MQEFNTIQELVEAAVQAGKNISEIVLDQQAEQMEKSKEELFNTMAASLHVMQEAVASGLKPDLKSASGLSGGNAFKLNQAIEQGKSVRGDLLGKMMVKALAVSEFNACMGRIVAAPTAGSCGIIPAVLITAMEEYDIPEDKAVMGLFTGAGIGMVIAKQASISGAEGGCQAECGSASAMAAAALVEILGGTPQMAANACAIALKNSMGLVCDPVAGLVEVPCVKRNASGAASALAAANLALAGIESVIPVDEVIRAMKSVGDIMSPTLKETAQGGIAATPTARKLTKKIFGEEGNS